MRLAGGCQTAPKALQAAPSLEFGRWNSEQLFRTLIENSQYAVTIEKNGLQQHASNDEVVS
jgi:hypothetical protein